MTPRRVGGGTYPVDMEESAAIEDASDLLSSLEVIEAQPLASRAAAYASLHDSLSRRLDTDVTGHGRP